jgi:hypothetical protein
MFFGFMQGFDLIDGIHRDPHHDQQGCAAEVKLDIQSFQNKPRERRSNSSPAQYSGGKEENRANQFENALHRDPDDAEGQQEHPDDRIQDQ